MDIKSLFLYCLYSILQLYILMAPGAIAGFKKILKPKSVKDISEVIMKFFLPVFAIIEVARMATFHNMHLFWLLMISIIVQCVIGFALSYLAGYIFKFDKRTFLTFSLLVSFPSVGSIPLVLGKSLCYPNGPLEGDPECENVLGYMMILFMVFCIIFFLFSFVYVTKDANINHEIEKKLNYLWYILKSKKSIVNKDTVVLHLFQKYFTNKKLVKAGHENFVRRYQLIVTKDYEYIFNENKNILITACNNVISFPVPETVNKINIESKVKPEASQNEDVDILTQKDDVIEYFNKIFQWIENNNINTCNVYKREKEEILKNLKNTPPLFPIVRCIEIKDVNYLNQEWTAFENYHNSKSEKKIILDVNKESIGMLLVLNKLYSPPIIGSILGFLIGLSGMRDILFSPNFYISSIVDSISLLTKTSIPLLSMVSNSGWHMNMVLSKKQIITSFHIRFIIMPLIGMAFVELFRVYYGGVVMESKVFRFAMYMPFCLPSTVVFTIIVTIVKFYIEETGYMMLLHNGSLIITLTLGLMTYFILIES